MKIRNCFALPAIAILFLSSASVTHAQRASTAEPPAHVAEKDDAAKSAEEPAAVAIKGTPKIDGEVEDAWESVPELKVAKLVTSESSVSEEEMATATVKLMWDETHLYALFNVKDDKLSDGGAEDWEADSVELFVDEKLDKGSYYGDDDAQYRVNCSGDLSGGTGYSEDNLKAVAQKTEDGYLVELSVKLSHVKPEAGAKLGIDLQVNDNAGDDARVAIAKWHHAENDSYMNPGSFGEVVLK